MEIFRCCRSCGQVSLGVKGGGINPISFPALYPPDPTDKHLSFPGWEERSPGKSREIVTRGYEEGEGGGFYGLPLFLHCTYAITKEEMPTSSVSVNEIIKSVTITECTLSQHLNYQHNLLKLVHTAHNWCSTRQKEILLFHCRKQRGV